ncbi:MAG: ketoacyl reductase, partial [Eubacteriales bacterium]
TRFDQIAGIEMGLKSMSAEYVARYAVDGMLRGKFMIVPGAGIKAAKLFGKIFPDALTAKGAMLMQGKKR